MKRVFIVLMALVGFASSAHAYDEDTHFYATYAMARYAGIRHEVATQIALSTQWMDESYISDPTSMIFMPITGIKKRRLLHFPSSRVVGAAGNTTEMSTIGGIPLQIEKLVAEEAKRLGVENRINDLQFMTETVEDHPFASELFMQGLKQGNLMMASAGLHTLEDSFAHAGTTAEQGHAFVWHWPDRPFSAPEKYMRMSHAVLKNMVAIRTLLPADALDCSVKLAPIPSQTPNCQMDAQTLGDNYAATAAIQKVISYDVLKDPKFVRVAIADLLNRATKAGYIKKPQAELLNLIRSLPIDGKTDTEHITEILLSKVMNDELQNSTGTVNISLMLSDMGRLPKDSSPQFVRDYVKSYGLNNLYHSVAEDLLRWRVPAPLDDDHKVELEDDKSSIRKLEMDLRIANMQTLIKNLYGIQLQMIPNPTKDDAGFDKEILLDPTAETKIKVDPNVAYVTFSLHDRNAFDNMIFKFLFPSLTDADLRSLVSQTAALKTQTAHFGEIKAAYDRYVAARQSIKNDQSLNIVTRSLALARLDHESGFMTQAHAYASNAKAFADTMGRIAMVIKPMIPKMLKDTVGTHIIPTPDNFFYRDDGIFKSYRDRGIVKPFLGQNDVWSLFFLKEMARMQAGRPPQS